MNGVLALFACVWVVRPDALLWAHTETIDMRASVNPVGVTGFVYYLHDRTDKTAKRGVHPIYAFEPTYE